MFNLLNTASAFVYVVDIIVVVVLCICAGKAAKQGFVACLFGLISTIVAIVLACVLSKTVARVTGGMFGLEGLIAKGCEDSLLKIAAFTVDISSEGIRETLAAQQLPQFLIDLVAENIGNEMLAKGTTLAMVVGDTIAELAISLIAWLAVFALAKLLLALLRNLITSLVENIPLIDSLNSILGFAVGALQGILIVSGIIAVVTLIPSPEITDFFNSTILVGWFYNHNPIHTVLGWILA